MSTADEYRVKAAQLVTEARSHMDPAVRDELFRVSRGYIRLAEQADRNSKSDITYESPPRRSDLSPTA